MSDTEKMKIDEVGLDAAAQEFWAKRDEPFVGRAERVARMQAAIEAQAPHLLKVIGATK